MFEEAWLSHDIAIATPQGPLVPAPTGEYHHGLIKRLARRPAVRIHGCGLHEYLAEPSNLAELATIVLDTNLVSSRHERTVFHIDADITALNREYPLDEAALLLGSRSRFVQPLRYLTLPWPEAGSFDRAWTAALGNATAGIEAMGYHPPTTTAQLADAIGFYSAIVQVGRSGQLARNDHLAPDYTETIRETRARLLAMDGR